MKSLATLNHWKEDVQTEYALDETFVISDIQAVPVSL